MGISLTLSKFWLCPSPGTVLGTQKFGIHPKLLSIITRFQLGFINLIIINTVLLLILRSNCEGWHLVKIAKIGEVKIGDEDICFECTANAKQGAL